MPITISPDDYSAWMRLRFPELNKAIDDGPALGAIHALAEESVRACSAISHVCKQERERFTYISMIHSSLYRHERAVPSEELKLAVGKVESVMIPLAASLGVEHRFLAFFYLLHNPKVNGLHAQFRPGPGEAAFANINREGTKYFQSAALQLLEAHKRLSSGSKDVLELLHSATADFERIVTLNRELAQTLDRDEFKALTEYFQTVVVQGRTLRGVNAGDQPWSYIIDLLLGVNLKHVFEIAFDRKYPPEVQTVADAIIHEFNHGDYLRRNYLLPEDYAKLEETEALFANGAPNIIAAVASGDSEILSALRDVAQTYLMTSNTHLGLARKFVPVDPESHTQIGSSGTNIQKFLKDGLIDERARTLAVVERLRDQG
ncbi:MAG: DUF1864 family protein [Bacteroidota bacterium]|nr:DUF1864 family protein [Bacteroidota bacterium]MDP4233392.1 DUF1864 family protein [Bacteroidota bacterium]MDP4242258.1 DUF1864 family protein [Bacteroidota bacterium]MDP4287014.1 DUF1864 family protein [Bacteroidota bacterium]